MNVAQVIVLKAAAEHRLSPGATAPLLRPKG